MTAPTEQLIDRPALEFDRQCRDETQLLLVLLHTHGVQASEDALITSVLRCVFRSGWCARADDFAGGGRA